MASSKKRITPQGLLTCDKCGSVMITRKLATKTSDKVKFIQINQCVMLKFRQKFFIKNSYFIIQIGLLHAIFSFERKILA